MSDAIRQLSNLLRECGLRPLFGLRAQGHMPRVEFMLATGATWDEIGKAIGWHGATVALCYGIEIERVVDDKLRGVSI